MSARDLPGAWFDAWARLQEARAVADLILECLPAGEDAKPVYDSVNRCGHLIAAVGDLLDLALVDFDRMEAELKGLPTPP